MRAGCFTLVFFATVPWQWGFVVLFGFGFGISCFLFAFDSLFLPEVPRFFTRELTSLLHQLQFCGHSARSIVHRHYSCSVASEFDPKSLLGRGVLGRVFSHCGQHALNSDYAEQRLIQNHWKTISSLENTCMQCHQQFKCKLRNAKKFRHALVPLQQFAMFFRFVTFHLPSHAPWHRFYIGCWRSRRSCLRKQLCLHCQNLKWGRFMSCSHQLRQGSRTMWVKVCFLFENSNSIILRIGCYQVSNWGTTTYTNIQTPYLLHPLENVGLVRQKDQKTKYLILHVHLG